MGIESLYNYLPERIYLLMIKLSPALVSSVDEIRLRANMPFSLTADGKNIFIDEFSRVCRAHSAVRVTESEMADCVSKLTRSSLYAYEDCIKNGYIPLAGGARAGVCGETVCENGNIISVTKITSVTLRVSRFVKDPARALCRELRKELRGVLVYSPPGGGKTTFLRSAAYLLSTGENALRVGLADERRELYVPEMNECLIDVVSGCPKARAAELLTRTMSPQVIVCDEIGASGAGELLAAQNCGVRLIASCHGESMEEIMRRPQIALLVREGVFGLAVRLTRENGFGSEISVL